jgi:hypothetical protein
VLQSNARQRERIWPVPANGPDSPLKVVVSQPSIMPEFTRATPLDAQTPTALNRLLTAIYGFAGLRGLLSRPRPARGYLGLFCAPPIGENRPFPV